MKVSLENIKFYNDMYQCAGDPMPDGIEALVEKINTQLGGVDEVIDFGAKYKDILIVKIVGCVKHPDADKLNVCKIDDGGVDKDVERDGDGYVQVVCGAPNARADLLTIWIPPSVVVPSTYGKDPLELEAREIRGQVSNGMLASPSELAISGDHNGIVEVDQQADPGQTFAEVYKLNDYIIDIENKMFTHRPDLFGMMGIAREIAGIQGQSYKSPDWYLNPLPIDQSSELPLSVDNQLPELVPRFMAVAMSGIEVKPSPLWLQINLTRVGIKPINNIVDITNYYMILTAQPLHAYDYDKVKALGGGEAKLVIRAPKTGEKIKLLGGKIVEPKPSDIMIATDKHLLGIGGVMGGADTEIDANTKNIILECANFDMYATRRTSMAHGLFTDASTRFTKGQSPLQCPVVFAKVIDDIKRLTDGKVASPLLDIKDSKLKVRVNNPRVKYGDKFVSNPNVFDWGSVTGVTTIYAETINERLQIQLSAKEIENMLQNVEIKAHAGEHPDHPDEIEVIAPFWRTDIEIAEDVVEEVGRLYGFNKLPKALPTRTTKPPVTNELIELKNTLRRTLASLGANEVLTYNFVHGNLLTKAAQNPKDSYKLRNALSPDLQYYRQSLTPSLLDKVHPNIKSGHDRFVIFEIGKSHTKAHDNKANLPDELEMLALTYASKKSTDKEGSPYYQARNYLDQLMAKFGLILEYKPLDSEPDYAVTQPFDYKRSAFVSIKETGTFIGIIGEYKNLVSNNFKLPKACAGFELGTKDIEKAIKNHTSSTYQPLSKFPDTQQDLCLKVSAETPYQIIFDEVTNLANTFKPDDVEVEVSPVDIYQGEKAHDHKQITLRLRIVSSKRTLTVELVNKLLDSIAQEALQTLKATRV